MSKSCDDIKTYAELFKDFEDQYFENDIINIDIIKKCLKSDPKYCTNYLVDNYYEWIIENSDITSIFYNRIIMDIIVDEYFNNLPKQIYNYDIIGINMELKPFMTEAYQLEGLLYDIFWENEEILELFLEIIVNKGYNFEFDIAKIYFIGFDYSNSKYLRNPDIEKIYSEVLEKYGINVINISELLILFVRYTENPNKIKEFIESLGIYKNNIEIGYEIILSQDYQEGYIVWDNYFHEKEYDWMKMWIEMKTKYNLKYTGNFNKNLEPIIRLIKDIEHTYEQKISELTENKKVINSNLS